MCAAPRLILASRAIFPKSFSRRFLPLASCHLGAQHSAPMLCAASQQGRSPPFAFQSAGSPPRVIFRTHSGPAAFPWNRARTSSFNGRPQTDFSSLEALGLGVRLPSPNDTWALFRRRCGSENSGILSGFAQGVGEGAGDFDLAVLGRTLVDWLGLKTIPAGIPHPSTIRLLSCMAQLVEVVAGCAGRPFFWWPPLTPNRTVRQSRRGGKWHPGGRPQKGIAS